MPEYDFTHFDEESLRQPIIPHELIRRYRAIPLKKFAQSLLLGMAEPNQATISAIGFHTGLTIHPHIIPADKITKLIEKFCRPSNLYSQLQITLSKMTDEEPSDSTEEPVSQFVTELILDAIHKNISDIHLEPHEDFCRIRFRRDGLLYEVTQIPNHLSLRVILRLKMMAQLNISERRLPQDGRIHWHEKYKRDIRISTCPTLFGEKIVLRILHANILQLDSHSLGMTPEQHELFLSALKKPQGLILVTGPTGSGKTMTLYSALHYLNQIESNIATVEDPIEIQMPGINQIHIQPKIGLDFATALRACLRQDPDIIMIGEIRDNETAKIAIQAAQTGHLVLTTLHTNSAAEALLRLQSMQIDTDQIRHSLSLIIAQRLIRKLCEHCKKQDTVQQHAIGCELCHHGYDQRTGIFECITNDQPIPSLSLKDAGLLKVANGETSYQELIRIINL